ncbi:MAG: hypothetical protein WBW33_06110, partial [Bryobacteraceae bacterium]
QKGPLGRGTHAKGVTVRGQFEVLDVTAGRDSALAARLAKGMFAKPGVYPAVVRFANSDSGMQSDFKPDVRSLSFSADLSPDGAAAADAAGRRQDFSLQSARTLPINDSPAFLAITKLLTAENPVRELRSLAWRDKLRIFRTLALLQVQISKPLKPYQQLRYWSNVPFRHGRVDVVKHSVTPAPENLAGPLNKGNPNALKDELIRHVNQDGKMSSFEFGLQLLDTAKMTYWGNRRDADFWIENASVAWDEAEAPFHTVARLTLLPKSQLEPAAAEATYFDVTGHSTADSTPLGSINRARWAGEAASRKARLGS